MGYIALLSNEFKSPGAVLNYLSGARTWVLMLGGSAAGFDTYSVSLVKRDVSRSADFSPSRALPLSAKDIMNISSFFFLFCRKYTLCADGSYINWILFVFTTK